MAGMDRRTGKVKWFKADKGYGFIADNDGGQEYFVHFSNIDMEGYRTLSEGDAVEFEIGAGRGDKPQALAVCKI